MKAGGSSLLHSLKSRGAYRETEMSPLCPHFILIIYLMEPFGSENVIFIGLFRRWGWKPKGHFFSLCLHIPHTQTFSIIQKKYLIFILKWKLFYNVVSETGDRDKDEGPEAVADTGAVVWVGVMNGWLLISRGVLVIFFFFKLKGKKWWRSEWDKNWRKWDFSDGSQICIHDVCFSSVSK